MITLINEERTVAGKGPVGFVNPVLYESEFHLLVTSVTAADITIESAEVTLRFVC